MTILLNTLLGLSFIVPYVFAQDFTPCIDNGSDWYTSVVGETPCRTYERLRKMCNSDYVLGILNPNTPPDTCNDQVADCCCNSIAFGLSMMCLTCQQGRGPSGDGIDAGVGTYQLYLKHGTSSVCTTNTNRSFTTDIQSGVCNNKLKIHNDFYTTFWDDGSWNYTVSREKMETTNAADGNNSFTHCASTIVNVTSSTQSQSTSPLTESVLPTIASASTLPHSSRSLSVGAVAGIAIGSVAFVGTIALFLTWLFLSRRRRADIEGSETSPRPFITGNTPSMSNSAATTILMSNSEPGASRRLRIKEQRDPPPRYTE